jgi:hypothetical protein
MKKAENGQLRRPFSAFFIYLKVPPRTQKGLGRGAHEAGTMFRL